MEQENRPLERDLNPDQTAAVEATEGPVRVIAGPGTGKTRTLVARYCHLVRDLGIAPRNILAVTFTNRAANEMKSRVRRELGDLDLGYICTFHAFAVQLLRDDIHHLNYPRNFIILDTTDQKDMLLRIFADMNLTLRDATVKRILDEVLEAKKLMADTYIEDILLLDNERLKARFSTAKNRDEEIFLRYLYLQKQSFGLDFNDLINLAVHLLAHFPAVREKWQDRMEYVMVDEFQDVSRRQYRLARLLAEKHGNLFIVGDPDQTIYSWRGSHVRMFLDFDKVHKNARSIALGVNYRSTPQIVRAAMTLIEKNATRHPVVLSAVRQDGDKPLFYHAKTDRDEADWICREILRLRETGHSLNAVAILYRSHHLTRPLEERFIEAGLPYRIYSGVEFYGRREIKDIVCYLRMLTSADDFAFLRTINVPSRKIGKKRLEALAAAAAGRGGVSLYEALKESLPAGLFRGTEAERYVLAIENVRSRMDGMKMTDAVQSLLDQSGYEEFLRLQGDQERLDNVAELKRSIAIMEEEDEEAGLADFLSRAALFANIDREDERETVKMMTIHAAKGMEFPFVFICGMDEGIFPGRRVLTPEDMEEERRLAYVAMTRARDRLYLTDAEGATNDGLFKYPSRFLSDAGLENLAFAVPVANDILAGHGGKVAAAGRPGSDTPEDGAATGLLPGHREGERVVHPIFGRGVVLEVRPREQCYRIHFDDMPTPRSIRFGIALEREESR